MTTAGLVGYPTVALAGRAGIPARMVKVMRLNGSPGSTQLVDARSIHKRIRLGTWPEAEGQPAEHAARSPQGARPAAKIACSVVASPVGTNDDTAGAAAATALTAAKHPGSVSGTIVTDEGIPGTDKKEATSLTNALGGSRVPLGTHSEDSSGLEAQEVASAANAHPEQRPAKLSGRWLPARVLPGFDGAKKAVQNEAALNPLLTLLQVNAHCLDVDVTSHFAMWYGSSSNFAPQIIGARRAPSSP